MASSRNRARNRSPLYGLALVAVCAGALVLILSREIGARRTTGWIDYAESELIVRTTLSDLGPDVRAHLEETKGWRRDPAWPEQHRSLSEGLRPRQIMDWSTSADGSVAALSTRSTLIVAGDRGSWERTTVGTKSYPAGKVAVSPDGSMVAVVVECSHVMIFEAESGVVLSAFEAEGSDTVSLLRWGQSGTDLFAGRRTLRGPTVIVEHWSIVP